MSEEFNSQTELGREFGASSHKIGKWLEDVGLRTAQKKPSRMAFKGGYCTERESTNPGTYFWVWHAEKTAQLFEEAGYTKAEHEPAN